MKYTAKFEAERGRDKAPKAFIEAISAEEAIRKAQAMVGRKHELGTFNVNYRVQALGRLVSVSRKSHGMLIETLA